MRALPSHPLGYAGETPPKCGQNGSNIKIRRAYWKQTCYLFLYIDNFATLNYHTVPKELTEEEKNQIIGSEDFAVFFDHSTRLIERALSEQVDIFTDYAGKGDDDGEG